MESYFFRVNNPETKHWIADIFLTKDGTLSAFTDYEPLGYRWSSMGTKNILDFILNTDNEYLTRKCLQSDKHQTYCHESTIIALKTELLKQRRERLITANQAIIEWNLINHFDNGSITFEQLGSESMLFNDIYEISQLHITKESYAFDVTKNTIFPELKKAIMKKYRIDKNRDHG